MTYDEETYVIKTIKDIKHEVHENNIMLKEIIKFIKYIMSNSNSENNNDFERNIMANLISNALGIKFTNIK